MSNGDLTVELSRLLRRVTFGDLVASLSALAAESCYRQARLGDTEAAGTFAQIHNRLREDADSIPEGF